MVKLYCLLVLMLQVSLIAQKFERSELPTQLTVPWEMTYGPDHFLWLTEKDGKVSRVSPESGDYQMVYAAQDYFGGSSLENLPICNSKILAGTLGLALHPDFLNPDSAFIYYLYSYNSGSVDAPKTKFKIKRLKWSDSAKKIIESIDLILLIPTSYDHIGGRLLAIKEDGRSYLFLSVGDHGKSEVDSPECYADQSKNPNNFTQDPTTFNGKIHRYNIDGTIPLDNPIIGNTFYTRGHRNPQGLMYNPSLKRMYNVEHGERTDDEVNVLYKGMNYGWKNVRGVSQDGNHPGEKAFKFDYIPDSKIKNDALVDAFYTWCTSVAETSNDNSDWCTVAPCDGIYYCSNAITEWNNSLLVTTLKDGDNTDMGVYQFKLLNDGSLVESTVENPNPKLFFGEDQLLNGRIRDITFSLDGKRIYLINTGGAPSNKITVYSVIDEVIQDNCLLITPNPSNGVVTIGLSFDETDISTVQIISMNGSIIKEILKPSCVVNIEDLPNGIYMINVIHKNGACSGKIVKN